MTFTLEGLMRLLHVTAAAVWFGGGLFATVALLPSLRGAGGAPFLTALMRAGGFGRVFGPASIVTVLTGGYLYSRLGYSDDPFGPGKAALTIGAILGILAFLEGLAVTMPTEMKLRRLARATQTRPDQWEPLARKFLRAGLRGTIMLSLSFVLMSGRNLL